MYRNKYKNKKKNESDKPSDSTGSHKSDPKKFKGGFQSMGN